MKFVIRIVFFLVFLGQIAHSAEFDGAAVYEKSSINQSSSQDKMQIIADALDYLLTNGVDFKYEKQSIVKRDNGYYVDLGLLDASLNNAWESAARKYRSELLAGTETSDDLEDLFNQFTNGHHGSLVGWFVVTMQFKDANNKVIYEHKFETGNFPGIANADACASLNFTKIQGLLGFVTQSGYTPDQSYRLSGRPIHEVSTTPLEHYYENHCAMAIGPLDKEDIVRIKKIDFSMAPRVNYGGKLKKINFTNLSSM